MLQCEDVDAGLLSLFGGCLVVPATLQGIRGVLGVKKQVPPAEAARVVANEFLVMEVVVISTSPEGKEVVQTPGELVAAVGINGLEQAQDNPDVHGQDVQVPSERTPRNGAPHGSEAQDHDLDRRRVFRSQTKRCRVLMVDFVNGLVERTPVKSTVREVVPGILHHEKDGDLIGHGPHGGEGNGGGETEELSHRVEEP